MSLTPVQNYRRWITHLLRQTKEILVTFGRNHNLLVCFGIICLNAFGRPALALFSRFASLFLHLPDFMINQLEATRMGVALAISVSLALATPYLKTKFSPDSALFDVWTTRVCFVLLAVGTVTVGVSVTLAGIRWGKFALDTRLRSLTNILKASFLHRSVRRCIKQCKVS
jgi:hypothetical protein